MKDKRDPLISLKYLAAHKQCTSRNKFGVLSFALAAVGFVFIILSILDMKSANYQYYTGIAFVFLIASVVTGRIAKRKAKQTKPGI